jgi:hypothetical protein
MKTQIEKVTATTEKENNEIVRRVTLAIDGITRIEEAYNSLKESVESTIAFKCGRGSNHIWVSNWKNERLMLITETRILK